MMQKKDFQRIADGFRYVANDPTADQDTVNKMVNEFCNAAGSLSPRFDEDRFKLTVFGEQDKFLLQTWNTVSETWQNLATWENFLNSPESWFNEDPDWRRVLDADTREIIFQPQD